LRLLRFCFRGDHNWVHLPGALDALGQPVHTNGVSAIPGIYFAGLDFATTRRSGTILSVTEEPSRLVDHMLDRPKP
jgi:putative flavoprotein involved in K+ transport